MQYFKKEPGFMKVPVTKMTFSVLFGGNLFVSMVNLSSGNYMTGFSAFYWKRNGDIIML